MAFKIDASFENGVFVPAKRPGLAERERVRLTIESVGSKQADSQTFDRQEEACNNLGEQNGHNVAIALDFHPDGC
jgi:predicted DNA-binding antitoxin AbrB/MazE fold protein